MTLLPAGTVNEVLAGAGASKDEVQEFIRKSHLAEHSAEGRSWAAVGILPDGRVWVLAGGDREQLIETLRIADVEEAEVLELQTLN